MKLTRRAGNPCNHGCTLAIIAGTHAAGERSGARSAGMNIKEDLTRFNLTLKISFYIFQYFSAFFFGFWDFLWVKDFSASVYSRLTLCTVFGGVVSSWAPWPVPSHSDGPGELHSFPVFAKKCKECHIMSPCKWNIMELHVLQMFHTVSMLVQWHLCHLCQVHVRLDQMDRAQASLLEKATSFACWDIFWTRSCSVEVCWNMLKRSWMRCNSAFLVVPHDPAVIVRLSRCLLVWSYVCVSTWHFA